MNEESQKTLDYWKMVNASTSEYESLVSVGAWNEADKLDDTDDDQINSAPQNKESAMNNETQETLDYWKMVNASTNEYESLVSVGAWNEADKLDDTDDDDKDDKQVFNQVISYFQLKAPILNGGFQLNNSLGKLADCDFKIVFFVQSSRKKERQQPAQHHLHPIDTVLTQL